MFTFRVMQATAGARLMLGLNPTRGLPHPATELCEITDAHRAARSAEGSARQLRRPCHLLIDCYRQHLQDAEVCTSAAVRTS